MRKVNQSIETVMDETTIKRVRELTQYLFFHSGERLFAQFVKKNGEVRPMVFVPKAQWNRDHGIVSTEEGKKMVEEKALRNMITVTEIKRNDDGTFTEQCRTLNLAKVIGDIVPAPF